MKNVPDELLQVLRDRPGDLPLPGSGRWGKVLLLHTGGTNTQPPRANVTFIATEILPVITPMAFRLRFSLDGQTFTPEVPALWGGDGVDIAMIETVDMKAGAFREGFTLLPGEAQPFCNVICRALALSVTIRGESTSLWVEAVAAPTTTVDCNEISPGAVTPAGFANTTTTRLPAITANTYNLAAQPKRALLTVANQSAANLFVHLGVGVTITPGSEFATIILPPDAVAGYEVLNYRGEVYMKFDADDGAGYLLVSEGFYP